MKVSHFYLNFFPSWAKLYTQCITEWYHKCMVCEMAETGLWSETKASQVTVPAPAPDPQRSGYGWRDSRRGAEVGQGKINNGPEVASLQREQLKSVVINHSDHAMLLFTSYLGLHAFVANTSLFLVTAHHSLLTIFYTPLAQFDILESIFKWQWMAFVILFPAYFPNKQNNTLYIQPHYSKENLLLSVLKTLVKKRNEKILRWFI